MNEVEAIEKRVRAFIADYATWNQDCMLRQDFSGWPSPCEIGFDPDIPLSFAREAMAADEDPGYARRTLEQLAKEHCTTVSCLTDGGFSFGSPSRHHPDTEFITDVRFDGVRALVATSNPGGIPGFWEYTLVKRGAEWRIDRLRSFISDDVAGTEADFSWAILREEFNLIDDVGIDFGAAFIAGKSSHNWESGQRETITVEALGEIEVPSGLIVVAEASEDPAAARPLEVHVPSGRVWLELARSGFYNAFVRVWLGAARRAVAYVPARTARRAGEPEPAQAEAGVRCGAFVLADAVAWGSVGARVAEQIAQSVWDHREDADPDREPARVVELPGETGGLAGLIDRGGGDVSCPCFWGLNDDGAPVSLVIDLRRCGDHVEETFEVRFNPAWLERDSPIPQFTEFGYTVFLSEVAEGRLAVRAVGETPILDLLDEDGAVLGSTERGAMTVIGDESHQRIVTEPSIHSGMRLRLRWRTWRHGFAR